MTLYILVCIAVGIALVIFGFIRRTDGGLPPWQSNALIALGLLMQSWWVLLLAMFLFKTLVLKQDT